MNRCLRAAVGASLLLLSSCSSGAKAASSPWVHLAEGFVPHPVAVGTWRPTADGRGPLEIVAAPTAADSSEVQDVHGAWIQLHLAAADWNGTAWPGVWWTQLPITSQGKPPEGAAEELRIGDETFPAIARPDLEQELAAGETPADACSVLGDRLYFIRSGAAQPPEAALLRVWCSRGHDQGGRWNVAVGRWSGDGLPLWSGEDVEIEGFVPPNSALTCTFVARTPGIASAKEPLVLRVSIDGIVLDEEPWRGPDPIHVRVVLPPGGARKAKIGFTLDGPAARGAVLDPVIGPADAGRFGARPWPDDRPSIVLFLADTFRADNLATYGGAAGLTPELDALAADSLTFERAWAPASWTLPSQASMMTGLYPYQHGATSAFHAVPSELVTIAEHLRAAGYRTGAATDQGFVTRAMGMDAGFEWFDQHWGTLDEMRASVERFLDADDGRPIFLFVQTYATHEPYRPSAATRAKVGGRLPGPEEVQELERELRPGKSAGGDDLAAARQAAAERYRELYLGTVMDLDRAFGGVRRSLEAHGVLPRGALIFTSDHGEGFCEHGQLGHGAGVWEEIARIPLVIHGAGIAPRHETRAAGLVDLPATICDLAGIVPRAEWLGRSLLDLGTDRPAFVFGCNSRGGASAVALIEGDEKLVLSEDALRAAKPGEELPPATLVGAFDLGRDPGETGDLAGPAPWALDLLRRHRTDLLALLQPRTSAAGSELDSESLTMLKQLGYLGR